MTSKASGPAPVVLVDDDIHAARLLLRTLQANGVSGRWLGPAHRARKLLAKTLAAATAPALVIVDLKAHSYASAEFLAEMRPVLVTAEALPVAVAAAPDRSLHSVLLAAGAAAVFTRHAERDAYRREVAAIVNFWVSGENLEKVGT
jgi:DNA-binding response OmpR family regulator